MCESECVCVYCVKVCLLCVRESVWLLCVCMCVRVCVFSVNVNVSVCVCVST